MTPETRVIGNTYLSPEEDLRELLFVVLQQDGGNPSQLLDLLSTIVQQRPWEKLGLSFRHFIEFPFAKGGVGWSMDSIEIVLKLKHRYEDSNREKKDEMNEMRQAVRELIAGRPGGDKRSREYQSNTENIIHYNIMNDNGGEKQGTGSSYALRTLRKKAPEIHARVIAGELSPHAGMVEAHLREPTITIPKDPEKAARRLLRNFSRDELLILLQVITAELMAEN